MKPYHPASEEYCNEAFMNDGGEYTSLRILSDKFGTVCSLGIMPSFVISHHLQLGGKISVELQYWERLGKLRLFYDEVKCHQTLHGTCI